MKTLDLVLKAKWYNMIESGVKTEEYREIKPYWIKRLIGTEKKDLIGKTELFEFKHFDKVRFHYGYTNKTMTFECLGITTGVGYKDWGALDDRVFIIKLGKRLE